LRGLIFDHSRPADISSRHQIRCKPGNGFPTIGTEKGFTYPGELVTIPRKMNNRFRAKGEDSQKVSYFLYLFAREIAEARVKVGQIGVKKQPWPRDPCRIQVGIVDCGTLPPAPATCGNSTLAQNDKDQLCHGPLAGLFSTRTPVQGDCPCKTATLDT